MKGLTATVTNPNGKDVQVLVLQFIMYKDKVCAIALAENECIMTAVSDLKNVTIAKPVL